MGVRSIWTALVTMGFTWVVAQVLLVRELLVAFHGNELTVGLALAGWLLSSALGSILIGRYADRARNAVSTFVGLQALLALALPAAVLAGRGLRPLLGLLPGELAGPGAMALIAAAVLLPVSAACGGLFAAGCRLPGVPASSPDAPAGAVYVAEAAGAVLGGVAVTYFLIPVLSPLQIALAASGVNLGAAAALACRRPLLPPGSSHRWNITPQALLSALLLALYLGLLLSPAAGILERRVHRAQWGGREIVFDRDSAYGNVAVLAEAGQYTFLVDGVPTATVPVPDIAAVEEAVHLPLLFHPAPDTILLIGGGIGGALTELLKHPVRRVDYVELDPLLIEASMQVGDPSVSGALADSRVRLRIADGRRFVQAATGRYDLVLIGLPPPETLALNRFYTREFFETIRGVLRPGGLLAVSCPGSDTYLSEDRRALNATLRSALQSAFPYVRAIPGETVFLLASERPEIETSDAGVLGDRLGERAISARLISPLHIAYKLDPLRADWYEESLRDGPEPVRNTDLMPGALLYVLADRAALTSPALHALLVRFRSLTLPRLVLPLFALTLVLAPVLRRCRHPLRTATPIALAATGFAGMALSVALLLAYQTFYGVLYRQLGLFTAASALGLALGGAAAVRWVRSRSALPALIAVEIALALTAGLAVGAFFLLRTSSVAGGQVLLLALCALAGTLVGAQFPLAARICIRRGGRVAAPAGALYAADLAGAAAGALIVSALLIPALGLAETCLLIAAVKALSFGIVVYSRKP